MALSEQDKASIRKRVWWQETDKLDPLEQPHILFVRAPITFGHSQVVIPDPKNELEGFCRASRLVRMAIHVCQRKLSHRLLNQFMRLKYFTRSDGTYLKLLVLRVSAAEGRTFKMHLVPYFESHATLCRERFHSRHNILPNQEGGLLGWLGTREDEVDRIEVDYPRKEEIDECATKYLKLGELANQFRRPAKESFSKTEREAPRPPQRHPTKRRR